MRKFLVYLMFIQMSWAQNLEVVGGYFPYWRSSSNADFTAFNYQYFAFVFPTINGGLEFHGNGASALIDFKNATQTLSGKRLVSVGSTGMAEMASDSLARIDFADTLRKFCRIHDFQGIDMDWESINNITDRTNFTKLMHEIRNTIDTTDLEFVITVGFGNYWLQWYENEALELADFLQIMIYDQTGTWASSPYGNHASMSHFKQAEDYWVGRGFNRNKLVMGLPFYGYNFVSTNGGLATAVSYSEVLAQFPDAKASDDFLEDATGHYFFNGPELIQEKVLYAKNQGFKGVFVWEIAQDNINHELSLTKALTAAVEGTVSAQKILDDNFLEIYPNPISGNSFEIKGSNSIVKSVDIYNIYGQLIKSTFYQTYIELSVESGVYNVVIKTTEGKQTTKRIVVR